MTLRSRSTLFPHSTPKKSSEVSGPFRTEITGINHSTCISNTGIPHSTWICSQCTFENQSNAQRCSICSSLRYPSSATRTSTTPLQSPIPNTIQNTIQKSTASTNSSNALYTI